MMLLIKMTGTNILELGIHIDTYVPCERLLVETIGLNAVASPLAVINLI